MEEAYSTELGIRIYDNTVGDYVYVGPDSDNLGLVEIKHSEDASGVVIPKEQALLVAEAIFKLYKEQL